MSGVKNKPFGFGKCEIMSYKKDISTVFTDSDSFFAYPFKCLFVKNETHAMFRLLVSVGKKYNKRAVKRNIIRRRAKESFRLNKNLFYAKSLPFGVDMIVIYVGKQEEEYKVIESSIVKCINKIVSIYE